MGRLRSGRAPSRHVWLADRPDGFVAASRANRLWRVERDRLGVSYLVRYRLERSSGEPVPEAAGS